MKEENNEIPPKNLLKKRQKLEEDIIDIQIQIKNIEKNYEELIRIAGMVENKHKEKREEIIKNFKNQKNIVDLTLNIESNLQNLSTSYQQKSSFDLPSQTDMIGALAIFIAKRMKQEAILFFFQNFKDDIEKTELLTNLFPSTYNLLDVNDYSKVPTLGGVWKNAFAEDIVNLPTNITRNFEDSEYFSDEEYKFFKNIIKLAELYTENKNPVDILYHLKNETGINSEFKNILELLTILNENFADYTGIRTWVRFEDLNDLSDADWERLFILMYFDKRKFFKDSLNIGFETKTADNEQNSLSQNIFNKFKFNVSDIILSLNYFEQINNSVQSVIKNEDKDKYEKQNIRAYFNILISSFNLIDIFIDENSNNEAKEKIKTFKTFIEETRDIYNATLEKNYQQIVMSSFKIIELLLKENDEKYVSVLKNSKLNNSIDTLNSFLNKSKIINLKLYLDTLQMNNITLQEFNNAINNISDSLKNKHMPIDRLEYLIISGNKIADYRTKSIKAEKMRMLNDMIAKFINEIEKNSKYITCENNEITEQIKIIKKSTNGIEEKILAIKEISIFLNNEYNSLKELQSLLIFSKSITNFYNKTKNNNIQILLKYTSLLVDILNAKNSKQLEEIISSHALPVGSYSLKRTSKCSIELGAFPGLYLGCERKFPAFDSAGCVTGFTTPVGLTLNWGIRRKLRIKTNVNDDFIFENKKSTKYKYLNGRSFSLMLSIIDIGTVVSYRLTNTSEGLPDSIKFSQVVAPGFYCIWGFKKVPLSLMFGTQLNPKLRSFDTANKPSDMLRFSLGVSMDIPLLRFYNKK